MSRFWQWLRGRREPSLIVAAVVVLSASGLASDTLALPPSGVAEAQDDPIHTIQHVIVIMQENRSFDTYFGTFPGADGIPMQNGQPTVCVPNPRTGQCVQPYHNTADLNRGGPHGEGSATADINGGAMDGFIAEELKGRAQACADPNSPNCSVAGGQQDVMGWHDAREIPNYWRYAQQLGISRASCQPITSC